MLSNAAFVLILISVGAIVAVDADIVAVVCAVLALSAVLALKMWVP